jgi:AraC-like DNA-binding protein
MTKKNAFLIDPGEIRKLVHKNAENSFMHTTYREELERFLLLAQGDERAVELTDYVLNADLQGKLSEDPLRNMRYLFIVNTGLATRFAIEAGAPQEVVYSSSDIYIRKADVARTPDEVLDIMEEFQMDFAMRMRDIKKGGAVSLHVKRCADYIYDHLHESLTLEMLARKEGLNPSYLSKLFAREMGMGVKDYIINAKINTAKNILRYSQFPILDISISLGYSSQSAFTAAFRKATGMTPKKYRDVMSE